MKRIITVTLLAALAVCAVLYSGFGGAAYSEEYVCDSSGIYTVNISGNAAGVCRLFPDAQSFDYSFGADIESICIKDGKVYILSKSDKQYDIHFLTVFDGSRKLSETVLRDASVQRSPETAIDNSGRFYIKNKNRDVSVFSGEKKLGKIRGTVLKLIHTGHAPLAVYSDGMYELNGTKVSLINDKVNDENAFSISDSFVGCSDGRVLGTRGTLSLNIGVRKNKVCETNNYIVALKGSTITAYDNKTGSKAGSVQLSYSPEAIFAHNGKVITIDGSKTEAFSDKSFTKSVRNTSAKKKSSPKLSFGEYKVKGKYIFIPSGTTSNKLKSGISAAGYEIGTESRWLGTGDKAVFTKGTSAKTYTFVVKGDITGEGNVNTRDINRMFDVLLGNDNLCGAFRLASDYNGDSITDNRDLVLTAREYY